jgi:thioredoxin-like negative regulator of GroEL
MAASLTREIVNPSARTTRRPKGRAWRRRVVASLLILAGLGAIGRKASPWMSREIQLWHARRAIAEGRLADAEERLALMIHQEPTRTRARLLYVEVLRRQGQITEAEVVLQRTIELGLPVELHAWEDFPRAEKSLRRVLEDHPDDREVRQALAEGTARRRK